MIGAQGALNGLISMGALDPRQVSVSTPAPARINYMYDFNDIFANQQQRNLFPSPYGSPRGQQNQVSRNTSGPLQIGGMARGGKVAYDFTDKIKHIMRYEDDQ